MSEKPKSPWHPKEKGPRARAELLTRTLADVRSSIRRFANEQGISYEIEEGEASIRIGSVEGDFAELRDHITTVVAHAGGMLSGYGDGLEIILANFHDSLRISVEDKG